VLFPRKASDHSRGVLVIGSNEFEQDLGAAGIHTAASEACGAVLVGMDLEFTYRQIAMGLKALLQGVPFIVCNHDAN
jgi:ribonucleotide monophosphatase NagD (HAD superfamily)